MYIVPFERLKTIAELQSVNTENNVSQNKVDIPFSEIFKNAIENVKETDAIKKQDTINLALGNMDDLHNALINATKASMAVDFAMEVRNKALDAYNEIMRMNV